ncbi:MAG: RHS repeat-associated core domain-containing protein [Phycisphaerales bacterium]|nr:RHS repeat-associated core domain-containing protein [Phycisphaerales bacterium]
MSYEYDLAGNRTRTNWPGGSFYVTYDHDTTGAVTAIRENGAGSGVGVLATYAYDNLGRRTSITRGNGAVTNFTYDNAGLLSELEQDLDGANYDQTLTFTNNPAGQAVTRANSDSDYVWTQPSADVIGYTANGLNQVATVDGANQSYDSRGNLTTGGYSYDHYNRLVAASGVTLAYDPAGRLYETDGEVTTRFLYDGADLIAEYSDTGTLLRRFMHGPGFDEPIIWYEGTGTGNRRWLTTDRLGSVTAVTDDDGAMLSINTYDEYGVPGSSNDGRFQYTGQMWLPEAGLYHYKARAYDPELGRFLQSDLILYAGGMNLYAYVGNDPVNNTDPNWLFRRCVTYNAGGTTTETTLPNGDVEITITAFPRTSCWE